MAEVEHGMVVGHQADGSLHINPQPSITDRPFDNGGMDAISLNGAPNTNVERGNVDSLSFVPPPDAAQQLAVVSDNYDASFGRVGGGAVSATLKSAGTACMARFTSITASEFSMPTREVAEDRSSEEN